MSEVGNHITHIRNRSLKYISFLGAAEILLHVVLIHSYLRGLKNSEWKCFLVYSGLVFLVWSEFPWGREQVQVAVEKVAQTGDNCFLSSCPTISEFVWGQAADTSWRHDSFFLKLSDLGICFVIVAVRKSCK